MNHRKGDTMKRFTKLLILTGLMLISLIPAHAYTKKELNQYKQLVNEYEFTAKRLSTLRKNMKAFKAKRKEAKSKYDKQSFKLYTAKLEDAVFQKFNLEEDLDYLQDEIDSFDELDA